MPNIPPSKTYQVMVYHNCKALTMLVPLSKNLNAAARVESRPDIDHSAGINTCWHQAKLVLRFGTKKQCGKEHPVQFHILAAAAAGSCLRGRHLAGNLCCCGHLQKIQHVVCQHLWLLKVA